MNLQRIRDKVIAANPEIMERKYVPDRTSNDEWKEDTIRLADVLLALAKRITDVEEPLISVESSGVFTKLDVESETFELARDEKENIVSWDLKKDNLEEQSEETLNFLTELLK